MTGVDENGHHGLYDACKEKSRSNSQGLKEKDSFHSVADIIWGSKYPNIRVLSLYAVSAEPLMNDKLYF